MKKLILLCTVAAQLAATAADAKERGCKAQWVVRIGGEAHVIAQFDARGQGKTFNRARESAKKQALECFWDAWSNRNNPDILSGRLKPGECHYRGGKGVRDYYVRDVKALIETAACQVRSNATYPVTVLGEVYGDKGCRGGVALSSTYTIRPSMCR